MREVKRRAKIGEKVKIVNAANVPVTNGKPEYRNGDVLEIIGYLGSQARYAEGTADNGNVRVLNPDEYIVLEGENEMRFKVGDKVRVREGLVAGNEYGDLFFNNIMSQLCGKSAEVDKVHDDGTYSLKSSIYYFNDAMLEPAPFTLSDLRPCMVVKQRDGDVGIVSTMDGGRFCINTESGLWMGLENQRDDLTDRRVASSDIMEVYGFSKYAHEANKISTEDRELLFKREEPKPKRKMTVAEICKELGEEIEIVKGE